MPLPEHVVVDEAEGHSKGGATHIPLVHRPYKQSLPLLQAAPGFPIAGVGADAGPELPDGEHAKL